jgi:protein TonB
VPGQLLASVTRPISAQLELPERQRPTTGEAEARRQPVHARVPTPRKDTTFQQTEPASPDTPRPASTGPAEIPNPSYYAARELDVYPALLTALDLHYRDSAWAADVKGRVLLLVRIDANGIVEDVSVVEAEPAGYFEEQARRALASARFRPALKDGRAVKSRVEVEVNYASDTQRAQ